MQSRDQKRRKIEVSSIGSVSVVETQNLVTQAQDTQNPVNNLLQSSTMVINQRQGIMFICYYNPATLTLIFVEPIKILKNNDTLMNDLIQQFNPEVIVCTSKVMALLGLDPNDLDLKIEVKPSKDFNIIDGELFIDSFERGLRRKDQIVLVRKLQNFISQLRISDDFTQYLTLLSIISTNIEMACEEHNQINKTDLINVMEFVPLNGYLYIDSDSMVSLKIKMNTSFEKEESLLKLFGKCFSKIGNSLLQEWLMRPLIDKGKIESRHVAIRKITKEYEIGNKQSIVRQLTDCIGGISDINGIIQKLRVGSYDGAIWKQIKSILYNLIKMKELIDNSEYLKDTECFVKFIESFDVGNLYRLNQILVSVIDFETDVDNICIKPNFDNTLQNYKTLYDEMEQILSEKAFELRNQLNIEAVIAYIPQFGYLVAIDKDQPIQSLEQNFDLVFTTATTFYYKNNSMTEMDENYGDLYSLIRDREIEILYNLQNKLFDYGLQNLTTVYQHIGEIDVLICFALVSIKNNFTKPVLVTEEHGVLELKDSFHPLIQSSNFITNNFEVTESKVIVVTGPNYSGKSTLMTQIGITIYLSQIGCYIPAQSGKLSIFKNILTRINTLESVNSNQSTFMKDCQQMSKCLSKATKDSLILIDEFGKGTDINDGPGLLGSILKFYIEQDENTPLVILTSHMTELFTREMLGELIDKIDFKQMTIYIENENLFKMTFLYQVAPGMTTTSAGLYCAKKSGIDQKVIEKAQFILNLIKQGQNIVSEFATLDESEMLMIGEHRNKIKKFLKLNFQDWPLKEQSKLKHEVLGILNS